MKSTTFFLHGICGAFVLLLFVSFSINREISFGDDHLIVASNNNPEAALIVCYEANCTQKVPCMAEEPVVFCQFTSAPKFPHTEVKINDQNLTLCDLLGKQVEYLNPNL